MMDLADIRKKARTQQTEAPACFPEVDALQQAQVDTLPAPAVQFETDEFLDGIGAEQFATEEEYSQGLATSEEYDQEDQAQWLGFYLGDEEYALDLQVVSELIKPRILTELPQVPTYLCGIISLRGEVIPVIDLKCRLGLKGADRCEVETQRIVVCEGDDQRIGLLVDSVSQVVYLAQEDIETPQLAGGDSAATFIQAVGRKPGKMLILLCPEKIMDIGEGANC